MTTVLLLTCDGAAREADVESKLVMEALTTYGIASTMAPWSSPSLLDIDADLVLIRSTWDYTQRLEEFLAVLDQLTAPIANPLSIVKWNAHKGYLTELAAAGVPIVPTAVITAGITAGKSELLTLPSFESADVIVKPAVSAGAVGVGKFAAGSAQAHAHLTSILESGNDALVQPFISDVVDGERSIIHLGGRYSHAVRKIPADNDFRVQEYHGGTNHLHEPSAAELALADAALAATPCGPGELLYARVDVVGPVDQPLLMEVELIEPELFLPFAPGSADALARAVVASLRP
ncbi:RimK family alpha-L-glutamate ligase [Rhodococcus sp. NPDC060176]|uniref:ATP-grasp domain-containing protein n=1 Tax=Rhodococcus sp. NPDC060176 TaxID=3347062 RepID=UPI003662A8E2